MGVASFSDTDRYWGRDPRFEVRTILEDARQQGWDEAVHRQLPARDRDAYRRIFDPRRVDWFYLGSVEQRRVALELGAGWGGVSLRLAKLFDHVVAVDGVLDRTRFAQLLFEQEGMENALAVHADPSALPLRPESCDLVVINDGFERAHLWSSERDPAAAQRSLLSNTYLLLRPGGSLCLGVTNRCSASSMLARFRGGDRGTALRHTVSGYRRLLESAGLAEVESYAAFPSHLHPRMMVPLSDAAKLAWAAELSLARRARKLAAIESLAHRLVAIPAIARLACFLSESLVIWARRPSVPATETGRAQEAGFAQLLKQRIIAEWSDLGLSSPRPSSVSVVQFSGNWDRGGKVNWFVFPDRARKPALVAKIARVGAEGARVAHEHEAMEWLRSLPGAVSAHIPTPLALWEVNGHTISLQEAAVYPPLSRALAGDSAEGAVVKALRLGLPLLAELALATRRDLLPGTEHPYLGELVANALSAAESTRYPPLTRELLSGLADLAEQAQKERCVPFTAAHHGDMSVGDLLADGKGAFRVIDWEWAAQRGLPFVDLVCLGISAASMKGAAAIAPTMVALTSPTPAREPYGVISEIASDYCCPLGLSDAARRPLAAAALLNLMLRMPNSRLSVLQLSLPSLSDPAIAAARALVPAVST
jgi:SAM-dependent methyltransferase